MSFAEKYGHKSLFNVDTKGFEYDNLENLYKCFGEEHIFTLRGIYISTKGHYGNAPVFILDDCFVNIPKHLLTTCQNILDDAESIALINNGCVGFTIREYVDKTYSKSCYTIDFVDIESTDDLPF